ncbi:MAG: prefoldin subunit beta [Nanoarchaeota archaeon]|nr:prefoldin subunit beta [Nanoarchaeota archaeon]
MNLDKETQQNMEQLQLLEQSLQTTLMQKQTMTNQLAEIDNALNEINKTETVYKVLGPVMIATTKKEAQQELQNKKETIAIRIQNLDKQEHKIKERFEKLQEDVLKELKTKE